ncbi:pentapeptide repeat-containing protein, partial [Paraburkholderia sp. RL17-373-BIF-A]|uniref:pentapeptide repeat-containing protein n=1 Tax=Paraburkholderia sp. RL17-373-BIF-A TaxID=3031629 RepID=UPI0038BAB03A
LKVSENAGNNGAVLSITVGTGVTSESFAIEGGTIDALRAVLEQEIVRHETDHYRYREATERIPQAKRALLRGGNVEGMNLSRMDLNGMNLSWANLSGAKLSGANLCGANLHRAYLSGVTLHQMTLKSGCMAAIYAFKPS